MVVSPPAYAVLRQARLVAALAALAISPLPAQPTAPTTLDSANLRGLRYRMVGPSRGGRVTTVTGVPQQPHTFYMGSTGGGVWKTTDAGRSWINISDGYFEAASMGALDVADSDPNIVYAGTGSDGIRSNVSIGKGIYRSNDAGKTWTHQGLRETGLIGAVVIHPANPGIVYAAAIGNPFKPNRERGVYRTKDGGKSWQKVLFLSDSTGAVDIELQPGNPNVVYAAMWRAERKPWTIISGAREGGVYKSSDGGDTWKKLTNGLPNELIGKIDFAVSAAMPNRLYALVEAKPGNGLYRSDDAGESFTAVNTTTAGLITRPFYYTNVDADPTNADVLYVGTEGFYKSTDGGKSFRTIPTPHGDNHDLWINPNDPNIMVQSNDGGANVSLDGGNTWSTQYNQPTAELYQVYVDNQFPYRLYGAQQDNSTLIVPSLPLAASSPDDPIQSWKQGAGCETGPIMPHPTNPDTVYGSCKGQYSRLSLRTGQEKQYWVGGQSLYGNPGKDLIFRFQRVSPMEVSPHDARTLYYGSQHVHRTRDEGVTWERISPDLTANDPRYQQNSSGEPITIDGTGEEVYSTLYSIRESPIEPGVIWTGANDGPFYVSRDAGKTWTNITPKGLPPGGRVQNIDPSPHRKGSAYYAVLRYLLGDFQPYLYRTDDYGKTWTRLTTGSNGIPNNHPTRVVREDPDRAGLLYAGTEFGMFVSFDNGARWQPFQLNLPATPITDLKVHRGDLVISTQGRSFWILDNLTPLHAMGSGGWGMGSKGKTPNPPSATPQLVKPREAYRTRYNASFGGVESGRTSPDMPQYPRAGAMIDYWLPKTVNSPVTLEIMDPAGKLVRSFSSEAPGETSQTPSEPGMRAPTMERVGTPRLTTNPGLNRFIWDLAYAGPWDANPQRSGRNGPTVVPGNYTVRLAMGDWNATQPLVLKIDPRVADDGVSASDLSEQLAHNILVRDMVSEMNRTIVRIPEARKRLANGTGAAADTLARLSSLADQLVTPSIRYSKPALQSHIGYLYGLTMQADQKIGRDAVERYQLLRKELDALLAQLNPIIQ